MTRDWSVDSEVLEDLNLSTFPIAMCTCVYTHPLYVCVCVYIYMYIVGGDRGRDG